MSYRRDELINKMIALQSHKMKGDWSQMYEEYRLFCVMLSDEGWYMDYNLAIPTLSQLYLHQVFMESKVLDDYMVKFYKRKLPSIVSFLKKKHQLRYSILKTAFKAHKKGYFELSIPVFLTQIEGLFFDLTEKELFSRGKGKYKENTAKQWVSSKQNKIIDIRLAILQPLYENDNISANFQDSLHFPSALSRNKILHGRDINYANETNSYKAISLLTYIATIIYDIENESETISWI